MKTTARMRIVCGVAALLMTTAAVAGCSSQSNSAAPVKMDASWAEWYHNVHDVKAHATIAVQGKFTGITGHSALKKIPLTNFEFTVDKVLHDPGHLVSPGNKVTVVQTGGTVDGVTHELDDDPLFTVSENCVLFLVPAGSGQYRVTGGPSGRFEIKDGAVTPATHKGIAFSGSTDAFAAEVHNS